MDGITKTYGRIVYAFPTSPKAKELGHYDTGIYYVEIYDSDTLAAKPKGIILPDKNSKAACRAKIAELDFTPSKYSLI